MYSRTIKCNLIIKTISVLLLFNYILHSQIRDGNILDKLKSAKKFEDIFTKAREIQFKSNDELIVAEITNVDVSVNGGILILDQILGSVFIFSSDGFLNTKIDQSWMEKIQPGIKFMPFNALFDYKGWLYIQQEVAPKGILFHFDEKLNYKGKLEFHKINNANAFKFTRDNNLICYIVESPDNVFLKLLNIRNKKEIKFGNFPKQFKNAIFRFPVQGITVDLNNIIYQINPVEPKIYVYNSNGKLITNYIHNPSFYKNIQIDFPERIFSPSEMRKMSNWTWTWSIHFVEPYFLIVQYSDQPTKKFYFDLWDIYGNCYTDGVETSKRILNTHKNLIYVDYQPPMEKDGKLSNPILIEYKFNFMK